MENDNVLKKLRLDCLYSDLFVQRVLAPLSEYLHGPASTCTAQRVHARLSEFLRHDNSSRCLTALINFKINFARDTVETI